LRRSQGIQARACDAHVGGIGCSMEARQQGADVLSELR